MTNKKILEKINEIIGTACSENKEYKEAFDLFRKYPNENISNAVTVPAQLESLKREITADIYASETKKAGNGNRRKAVEKYIKETLKIHERLGGVFNIDEKQYISNGYTGFKFNKPFEGLQEAEEPFERLKEYIDGASENMGETLDLPDVATLKAYIKEKKASMSKKYYDRIFYDFGEGLPLVRASFLLDVYNILGFENLKARASINLLHAIYFKNENGEAVLMPVYSKEKQGH